MRHRTTATPDWVAFIGLLASGLVLGVFGIGAVQTGIALRQIADRKRDS